MKKLKAFVESNLFQNFILGVIIFNAVLLGLQTNSGFNAACGSVAAVLDVVCLGIFIVELLLKLIVYRLRFFTQGWNWFDLILVVLSLFSSLTFLSAFRAFRVFRVLRSLKAVKALKSLRSFRVISGVEQLRVIIGAIGRSLPGIAWSAVLLLLIYYIFSIMGVSLFGATFPDWFGSLGKSMYTLFQVMTLESWSMGISRPVMAEFAWAWMYFVPFVLITAFVVMNVVVGIVVNSISEVTAINKREKIAEEAEEKAPTKEAQLREEFAALHTQMEKVEALLAEADSAAVK